MKKFAFLFVFIITIKLYGQVELVIEPSRNNTIEDAETDKANGKGNHLFFGRTANQQNKVFRTLVYFDLSALSADATIISAGFSFTLNRTLVNTPTPVAVHRVLADWGEGDSRATGQEGNLADETSGDATWTHRFFDQDQLWNNAGGDYVVDPSGNQSISGEGDFTFSSQGILNDVNAWYNDPESNFGWIIIGDETKSSSAMRISSRHSDQNRPRLVILYDAPNFPPVMKDTSFTVSSRVNNGDIITNIAANDPDDDDLTYTILQGDDQGVFSINTRGDLFVNDASLFSASSVFELLVEAEDQDGEKDTGVVSITVDVINSLRTQVRFSPNPAQDKLYLLGADPGISYQICNMKGQTVQQGHLINAEIDMDLTSGMYFLIIDGRSLPFKTR